MKAKIILFIAFFSIIGAGSALAQDFTVSKAESDYRYQFDQYRTAYQTYVVNRNEYFGNPNLKAGQEALDAAKAAALSRDDVLRTFGQWLRLELLQYSTTYPTALTISNLLSTQNEWYLLHKDKVSAAGNIDIFEKVMTDYETLQSSRDKLYLQAQIELKLAWLNQKLLNSLSLFSPINDKLQNQTNIPEVEQGLVKIKSLQDQIKNQLTAISRLAPGVDTDGRALEPAETNRRATQSLDNLRTNLVAMVSLMRELETRYAQ